MSFATKNAILAKGVTLIYYLDASRLKKSVTIALRDRSLQFVFLDFVAWHVAFGKKLAIGHPAWDVGDCNQLGSLGHGDGNYRGSSWIWLYNR
jgi:hypothetical protein